MLVADYQKDTGKIFIMVGDDKQGNELRELEIVHVIARMDNAALYDELIQDEMYLSMAKKNTVRIAAQDLLRSSVAI